MNNLYSLNVKVTAFDSENPREQSCFTWNVSLNRKEQKRLCWLSSRGRCFPEEMQSILSQMTLVWASFAVFQGRACGCIQGTSAYRSLGTPSRTMQTPHTLSGGHSFCSLACQVSFCLLGRQIELGSAHTYQSYIWEGVETLGFFGLTGESGNKKHPHRRFLSGKRGRSLHSSSLPLTPRTFLSF